MVDLLPYLDKGYTPNLDRVFKKYPQSLGYSVNPAGKLPALPQFLMLESNYLEQNFMINSKWLDKLGTRGAEDPRGAAQRCSSRSATGTRTATARRTSCPSASWQATALPST